VAEREGVRGRRVAPAGRAKGAEAAAGVGHAASRSCTNTSK
jgi:hypothetical protein